MKKVRVGIVGLGEVAQIIHLPVLESLADRYEIAALCDVSPGVLQAMGERYGVNALYSDASEMASQSDLDAALILNSNEYHKDCAIAALLNRKHVLIEKPMTLTVSEADEIIKARDESGVQVMVGYMRRFAPAFERAVEEVKQLNKIHIVKVRDIIGPNHFFINQSSKVIKFNDTPMHLREDRNQRSRKALQEALGDASPELHSIYHFLCGLSSHDLSAMRELIGFPDRVLFANQSNGGRFLTVIFDYGQFVTLFETGVDQQGRFDAQIEVIGENKTVQVRYDTPYIRHLPTTLNLLETVGDSFEQKTIRPTYKDPYTLELEAFYEVVTQNVKPKTTPEDYKEDLEIFRMIIDALKLNSENNK